MPVEIVDVLRANRLFKAHASVIIIIIIADHDQAVHVCACL